ncbi:CHAT domain-containing protein [Actinophytocola sp. NPDC049390]|uniref:CHAT domain-containing protein n=1 Tax=Actinophytocola sp. NPDC049390 TaxID=3363894 RepID=UPI0037AF3DF4
MPRVVDLLTGELDYARCDAGCRLNVRASVVFQDMEAGRVYVAPGDLVSSADMAAGIPAEASDSIEVVADVEELRRVVGELVDRRLRVFLPVLTGGPENIGDVNYLGENWRSFTAPVMAAVGVSLTGRVPAIRFVVDGAGREHFEDFVASRQSGIWLSMLIDWTNGEGVGSFEEDLAEYVDRTTYVGDPLLFAARLDELEHPADEVLRSMDAYRREALRASLHALVGQPNPLADRWAYVWLMWELDLRLSGGGGVAEVPGLAVSAERLRRTVPPDSARFAGAMLLNQALAAGRDDSVAGPDVGSFMTCLQQAFHDAGFDEQLGSIFEGTRLLDVPIEQVADRVIEVVGIEVPDRAVSLTTAMAMAGALVEAGRADDLKRVADAMRVAVPTTEVAGVSLWYYRQLLAMRKPTRLLEEVGETSAPGEAVLPLPAQADMLQLRVMALRMLGRQADALTLLDSAPQDVLDEPGGKQSLGIARARLERELGSPAAALTRLEALLAEDDDPQPPLHESLMATLLRFGRYEEAADHGRAAYARALRDRMSWPAGRYAAQAMWCQALGGSEPDTDLVDGALGGGQLADSERDLFAATALLTTGVAESDPGRREFLDRVRTESEQVLEQALAERDVATAARALYVAALYDQVYRPGEALNSWYRMVSVMAEKFDRAATDGYLYSAANLITAGELAMARVVLKRELGGTAWHLGHDSGLRAGALAGTHTAREISLVTAAMFAEPGATQADLRLVGELRRGLASRAARRSDGESAWRRDGLDDEVVAGIAPSHGSAGVLEFVSDGAEVRALVTVVDSTGSVASTAVPLPDIDLGRLATRMRSRLSTWRVGRPGDPFGVAEWQICRTWLDRLIDDHLTPNDHLVVIPFADWRQLPWHVAAFDLVTCSYEPSWVALLSTVAGEPLPERLSEGVVAIPRVGDPTEITEAMARYVAACGDGVRVLDGVAADRDAVTDLLANVDLATLLTHGYTSAAETEVALMLAADGSLPLAHSIAAASERGRGHRFGWREYAELTEAPQAILSAACGTGGGHIVGLGEHLGIYNVLRQVGLRTYVAPQWDIMAADVLPILGDIRARLLMRQTGLGECVRQAVRQALRRGVPAWSAHALILEGDWR